MYMSASDVNTSIHVSNDFVTNSYQMVSPGTHLLKNHVIKSCNQAVNLKTDSKTLYYILLKLK